MALTSDDDNAVDSFLERKRQWLFNTVREMDRVTSGRHAVPRFMTGTKIPYRGRKMPLVVRRGDSERLTVTYRNGFVVDLPHWVGKNTDSLIASEIKHWLKQRARRDVQGIASDYGKKFGVELRSIRVTDLSSGWGSCGPQGNILIIWHLIFAPRKVLEYVVVHELAHLSIRSHCRAFWEVIESMMPGFDVAMRWLEKNQTDLSSEFLEPL